MGGTKRSTLGWDYAAMGETSLEHLKINLKLASRYELA
jgi:hypothetical protein